MSHVDQDSKYFDVVIVGAGLVGAALALSLRELPIKIALIDARQKDDSSSLNGSRVGVDDFEPRVSALTHASQSLLKDLHVWPCIKETRVSPYSGMHVWDELGTESIRFDASEMYVDHLGVIVENAELLSAMTKELVAQDNVDILWGEKLASLSSKSNQCTRVQLASGLSIDAELLVGADGANSKVRALANIPTREWDYEHQAIVCTVETEKSNSRTCYQRFSENGPLAFLPLRDDQNECHFSSIVWSTLPERAAELLRLDDSGFKQALADEIERKLGSIVNVSKRYSFPLRQRHAKHYTKNAVVLVGDAAHTIHPLAGQGVNLGFKDVVTLSRVIQQAEKDKIPLSNPVYLKRYQRERQGDNLMMMGVMEGFKRTFASTDPLIRWVRNTGLGLVNRQNFIKNEIAKLAMGLSD